MQVASWLMAASAGVLGVLGGIHLIFTFSSRMLDPRDPAVRTAMETAHPMITRQTTVWRATKGFNASHSLGLIAMALVYGHLALWQPQVLEGSSFLLALGMAVQMAYLVLAHRYFFSVPFRGIAVACTLFASGWAMS